MKFIFLYFISMLFFSMHLFGGNNSSAYLEFDLKPFWRYEPVIGRWLSGGQGLVKIPEYMKKTSFPYQGDISKPQVPFAKGLSVVRLLGGWDYRKKRGAFLGGKDADLVYRENGVLKYRWHLLKQRLDPYIEAGYRDLTLVLDNIPWALVKKGKLGPYGQINPPADMKAWEKFIEAMCQELVKIYGKDVVKNFRFRIGTENQSRRRFNGSFSQYVDMYIYAQKAILKVLPDAKIAPFNFAGGKGQVHNENIDMARFVSLEKSSSFKDKPRISFLPVSTYMIVRKKNKNNIKRKLDAVMNANKLYYDTLFSSAGKTYPKEIEEFGILNRTLKHVRINESGARGTAWRMYLIDKMIEQNFSRLYHWDTFDKVGKGKYLLKGNGWLYTVLDYLSGGKAYLLPTVTDSQSCYRTLVVKKGKSIYLLTTAFPIKKDNIFLKKIIIKIPHKLFPKKKYKSIKWCKLDVDSSVLDVLRNDLDRENLLSPLLVKDYLAIGKTRNMTDRMGKRYIFKHWQYYKNIIIDSLTLKKFPYKFKEQNKTYRIEFFMNIPSVSLVKVSY